MLKQPGNENKKESLNFYRALNAFGYSDHGKTIIKYLESEKTRLQDKNTKEDDLIKLRQIQGATQTIMVFLKMVEKSNEEVRKLS